MGAVLFAIIIHPAVTVLQMLRQRQKRGGHENSILITNDTQVLGVRLIAEVEAEQEEEQM